MSKTKSQTAMTAHGDVEYDTVSCKNCGNEVLTDDAVFVGTGLHESSCSRSVCSTTHETYRESVPLCEFCSKETVGHTGSLRDEINKPKTPIGYLTVIMTFLFGTGIGFTVAHGIAFTILAMAVTGLVAIVVLVVTES